MADDRHIFFVGGPRVDDANELQRWLAGHGNAASVKLPFTIRRSDGQLVGAVGKLSWRLDDSGLPERLAQREVWLSGTFTGSSEAPTFKVLAVHELVQGEGPHFAKAGRRPECLTIQVMKKLHCARGPARCEQCKAAAAEPSKPKLLDLCPWPPNAARPVVDLVRNGATQHRVYEVLKTFDTVEQARSFATDYGLEDVKL